MGEWKDHDMTSRMVRVKTTAHVCSKLNSSFRFLLFAGSCVSPLTGRIAPVAVFCVSISTTHTQEYTHKHLRVHAHIQTHAGVYVHTACTYTHLHPHDHYTIRTRYLENPTPNS